MLLRQKPIYKNLYIGIDDIETNEYLQSVGFIPKYYDNHIYYYRKSYLLKNLVDVCNKLKDEKEVSKFGGL